jgi:lysylphosphatidylglycerol synthetase-like protein (DUF2156 family)
MKLQALTRWLYVFAFFWLAFAIIWFFRDSPFRYLYSILGTGYSLAVFILAHFVGKKKAWAWWGALCLVGAGIVASIFDQVGWIDMAYIVFSLFLFISLLKAKPKFTF